MMPLISQSKMPDSISNLNLRHSKLPNKISNLPHLTKLSYDGTWIKSYDKNLNAFLYTSTSYDQNL